MPKLGQMSRLVPDGELEVPHNKRHRSSNNKQHTIASTEPQNDVAAQKVIQGKRIKNYLWIFLRVTRFFSRRILRSFSRTTRSGTKILSPINR